LGHPKPNTIAVHTNIPSIGIRGTIGVLKPLTILGFRTLIIHTPAHTRMNAKRVPMLVISPATLPGMKAANNPTKRKEKRRGEGKKTVYPY
jgi:hypothetical protein